MVAKHLVSYNLLLLERVNKEMVSEPFRQAALKASVKHFRLS